MELVLAEEEFSMEGERENGVGFCSVYASPSLAFGKINKQWEVIALEQWTSHMTLNAGPQQQRPEICLRQQMAEINPIHKIEAHISAA